MTMTHLNIGILAHVDAGKTTLSEAMLYETGATRRLGRVDDGDAFLDTDAMEKARGITIFSKQAEFTLPGGQPVTLVDTPGHTDFSPEMERTLGVLDYAILVVSALDGIDGQLPVLWRLLEHYQVPAFLFVNKMDRPGMDRGRLYQAIRERFGAGCLCLDGLTDAAQLNTGRSGENRPAGRAADGGADDRTGGGGKNGPAGAEALQEELAVLDDALLDAYLEKGRAVTLPDMRRLVRERKLFPVCFGSALKAEGVREFLALLSALTEPATYPSDFGARIFKITRDGNARLSWVKLTGGRLRARQLIATGADGREEKVDQIRRYSGTRFQLLPEAEAGDIVALTGLSGTKAGQGLGTETGKETAAGLLQPILTCTILLPPGTDPLTAYQQLRLLEEEEPMLHIVYEAEHRVITAEIMGQVQKEILSRLTMERFGMEIGFGPARILYRETIRGAVEGVGHFEPLRHYAEVHLRIEAGPPGSGIRFGNVCRTDDLAVNWQKQILSDLEEMDLRGVLTGAELTDVRITLLTGRASTKHTEGGDFREAAGRAVRQGLMSAENILLEPVLAYRLEVPPEAVGRAMSDMIAMGATCEVGSAAGSGAVHSIPDRAAEDDGTDSGHGLAGAAGSDRGGSVSDLVPLAGRVPAPSFGSYAGTVASYTGGRGTISTRFDGYEPCHNAEEVIAASGYIAELDTAHPASSVFCSHGVGTIIPWDEVRNYMHVESEPEEENTDPGYSDEELETYARTAAFHAARAGGGPDRRTFSEREADRKALDDELRELFEKTYGPIRKKTAEPAKKEYRAAGPQDYGKTAAGAPHRTRLSPQEEYLLVDGYNIIFAWEELRELAQKDIKSARDRLADILINYGGYSRAHVILVFDAYRVQGGTGEVIHLPHLDVIYTKEAETADLYIEKAAGELRRKNYRVTVATSDAVEQVIIFGAGAVRMSAQGFYEEVKRVEEEIRANYLT